MSGITPIIDTLLHQVLGRRDAPVERPLPDTLIVPAQPGGAAAKAYSDSRLDPRALLPAETRSGAARKLDAADPAPSRAGAPAEATATPAAAIRFSNAARTIAEILARFPAPPSALRIVAPLLARGEPVDATRLAMLLRASIETSGLFYESHLRRWRGGSLPLQRLLSEPQMLWTAATASLPLPRSPAGLPEATPPTPGAQPGTEAAPGGGAPTPSGAANANAQAGPSAAALTYAADGKAFALSASDAATASGRATGDPTLPATHPTAAGVDAGLAAIVRQQLELLVAPVLHWEGAPWSGVFMTLTVQPPVYHEDAEPHSDDAPGRRADQDAPWQSQLVLQLARLGQVKVGLQLHGNRVALDLAGVPDAAARMQGGSPDLRARLGTLGFDDVAVHVRTSAADAGDPHA